MLSLDPTRVEPNSDTDIRCFGECFLGNRMEMWEQGDSDAEEFEPFLRALGASFYLGVPFSIAQVAARVRSERDGYTTDRPLRDALPSDLLADVNTDKFTRKLAWAFRHRNGTRFGDEMWRVERAGDDTHAKTVRWRVVAGE